MPGGGSILAMIQSLRNNKNLLRKRGLFNRERSFFDRKKEYHRAGNAKLDFKKVSKEDLQIIRKRIIKQRKVKLIKNWSITIIFFSVLGFGVLKMIGAFDVDQTKIKNTDRLDLVINYEDYNFFIAEGDRWMRLKHWDNAIYQFKKAVELLPIDYDANFKLATAYSNKCQPNHEDCKVGIELTIQLLEIFPNDTGLINLHRLYKP